MKYLLSTILIILLTTSSFGQVSQKKKIVVVPYGRFEFISDFPLEEIAKINDISADKVFGTFQISLNTSLINHEDEKFEFVIPTNASLKPIKRKLKRTYGKFERQKYNASDISSLTEEEFSKFMEAHQADYVIFINWYHIKKTTYNYVISEIKRKRKPYSYHLFDYDMYNISKKKIIGKAKVQAICNPPTASNIYEKSLGLTDVNIGYTSFAKQVIESLNKSISLK